MRPIKFRVWSMSHECMLPILREDDFGVLENNDHIVMQFTGLHDKNGKEIWEGDVVINRNNNWAENLKKPCIVEYEEGGFNPFVGDDRAWETKYVEVLGNIYENPELLEKK